MLARGRRAAERLMVDRCRITEPSGELVTNPDTGVVTRARVTVYEGKCKTKTQALAASNPEAGEHSFTVISREVHIPANAADVKDGQEVEMLTSTNNAFLPGKVFTVMGYAGDSYDTAMRLPVKEITG